MKRQDKVSTCIGIILMMAVLVGFLFWTPSEVGLTSIGDILAEEYGEGLGTIYYYIFGLGILALALLLINLISKIFSIETEDEEYFRLELKKLRKDRRKKDHSAYKKIAILKAKRKLELLGNE